MRNPRSVRRSGAVGVGAVACLGFAALLLVTPGLAARAVAADEADTMVPVLTAASGRVEVRTDGGGSWEPASVGLELQPGDTLRTGPVSKAEVTHPTGTIRLFEQTVLRLPMRAGENARLVERVELLAGQSLFDVFPTRLRDLVLRVSEGARSLFEVVTPHIVAGVKGTRFAVAVAGDRSLVGVYSGSVETSDHARSADQVALLGSGQMAEYTGGRLGGVSSLGAGPGFEGWADPETRSAPGLQQAAADTVPAAGEVTRARESAPQAATAVAEAAAATPAVGAKRGGASYGGSAAGGSAGGGTAAGGSSAGAGAAGGGTAAGGTSAGATAAGGRGLGIGAPGNGLGRGAVRGR